MAEFIAHRGAHDIHAENTLEAFARATELAFDAVELDVHATADGVCVVHHDETVIGLNGAMSIRGTSFETLREAAPAVPRLDEVLELLAGRARVYVEIKGRGIEGYVADAIATSQADCAVHGFDHEAVRLIKAMRPELRTGILQSSRLVDSVHALRAAGATDLWQWHEFVDARLVDQITEAGGRVIAWTANTPAAWRALEECGVAGICTDLTPHHAGGPQGMPMVDVDA